MRIATYSVVGLLIALGVGNAQPRPAAGADEAALRALEEKWDASNLKGDVAGLNSIFADGFISTNPEGKVRTKAEVIAQVKSGEIKYQVSKAEELKIMLYGDAAVINGRWRGKFVEKGKPVEANERFTDFFVRINGQWRCVASQASTIK